MVSNAESTSPYIRVYMMYLSMEIKATDSEGNAWNVGILSPYLQMPTSLTHELINVVK